MDGTTKDSFRDAGLFRPASQQYAHLVFPDLIIELASKKVFTRPISAADGIYEVIITSFNGKIWKLRAEDYERCLKIVEDLGSYPFTRDRQLYLNQINNMIKVRFSDRSMF